MAFSATEKDKASDLIVPVGKNEFVIACEVFCREGSNRRFATLVMKPVLDGTGRSGPGNLGLGTCEAFAENDDAHAKKRHIFEQELANRIEPGEATNFGVKDW